MSFVKSSAPESCLPVVSPFTASGSFPGAPAARSFGGVCSCPAWTDCVGDGVPTSFAPPAVPAKSAAMTNALTMILLSIFIFQQRSARRRQGQVVDQNRPGPSAPHELHHMLSIFADQHRSQPDPREALRLFL